MRIKTKSQLNTVFLGAIILMVGLTQLLTYRNMNEAIEKGKVVEQLNRGVFELNLMAHDYLQSHKTRALAQWKARYASLGTVLNTVFKTPEEKLLLEEIKEDFNRLGAIFSKLTINYQTSSNRREMPVDSKKLESRLVEHLMARLGGMISAGNHLAKSIEKDLMSAQRNNSLAIMFSVIILAVIIALNSILVGRSIVKPIAKLEKGTQIIGSGNLYLTFVTLKS